MRNLPRTLIAAALLAVSATAALAQGYSPGPAYRPGTADLTGSLGGRAPWQAPHEYDSGGGNDRRPDLPYYQQGRGQQTGGPDRNLLHYDGGTFGPQ